MGIILILIVVVFIALRSVGYIYMPWDNPPPPPPRSNRSKEEKERMDEIRSSVGLDPEE